MNIFEALKGQNPYDELLRWTGIGIYNLPPAFTNGKDRFIFAERLQEIMSILKTKAINLLLERSASDINFLLKSLTRDHNLITSIKNIMSAAIRREKFILDYYDWYDKGQLDISSFDNSILQGPIYHGADFDKFLNDVFSDVDSSIIESFRNEILISVEGEIDYHKYTKHIMIEKDEDVQILKHSKYIHSKLFDLVELPTGNKILAHNSSNLQLNMTDLNFSKIAISEIEVENSEPLHVLLFY